MYFSSIFKLMFGFYNAKHNFDNKECRVAGFIVKIYEVLIIIQALE